MRNPSLSRLDRKIEFPLPDRRQKRLIFSTITAKMNLSDEVLSENIFECNQALCTRLTWKITWRDLTESLAPTSMPSARRPACTLSEKTGIWLSHSCCAAIQTKFKVQLNNSGLFLTLGFSPRYIVLPKDFEAGYKNNIKKDESEHEFYK